MKKLRHLIWLALPLLLWWLLRQAPLNEIWNTLQTLSLAQLIFLAGINLGITLLFSSRWWLILRAQGHAIPYFSLAGYRLAGFAVSYFTPGTQFGGEPLQVYLLQKRHGLANADALAAVTLDKLFELLTNFAFLVAGLLLVFNHGLLNGANAAVSHQALLWAVGVLSLPLIYLILLSAGRMPLSWLSAHLPEAWHRRPALSKLLPVITATEERIAPLLQRQPWLILAILALSASIWLFSILEYWLSIRFLGARLSPFQTIAALTAARIAFLTPLPGGLGALEASQAFALQALGFSPALGISASLLIRARDVLLGLLGLWAGALLLRSRSITGQDLSTPAQAGHTRQSFFQTLRRFS
ncbi:MAG: lysylphosphatidylglycerol synthase transmembrane domain-containing protein [Chloroflexota bacterium]